MLETTTEALAYHAADWLTSAEDDDHKVELTYGVLGLGSNVYEGKQSYATGTAYLKTVTRKHDAVGIKPYEARPSGLALTYTGTGVSQLDTSTDGTSMLADYLWFHEQHGSGLPDGAPPELVPPVLDRALSMSNGSRAWSSANPTSCRICAARAPGWTR